MARPSRQTTESDGYVAALQDNGWIGAAPGVFKRFWEEAAAALPEMEADELYLLTGLLLPIWSKLPGGEQKVMRAIPEGGAPLLGRALKPEEAAALKGMIHPEHIQDPQTLLKALEQGQRIRIGAGGRLALKFRAIAGQARLEAEEAKYDDIAPLKALGCFSEQIQWTPRVFLPWSAAAGQEESPDRARALHVLESLLKLHPVYPGEARGEAMDEAA